jgi:hypothetical protein
MNERIRQLAEQAKQYAEDKQNDPLKIYTLDCFNEKFAELFVQECVCVCNKQTPNWKGEYATAFGDGVEFCISGIKEHFGVEE